MTIKCSPSSSSPILFHASPPHHAPLEKIRPPPPPLRYMGPCHPYPSPTLGEEGGAECCNITPLLPFLPLTFPLSLPSVQGVIFICHNPVIASPLPSSSSSKGERFSFVHGKSPYRWRRRRRSGSMCEGDDGRYKKCPCEHGQGSKSGASLNQNPGVAKVFTPKNMCLYFFLEIGTFNDAHR